MDIFLPYPAYDCYRFERPPKMLATALTIVALTAMAFGHGDHDHQTSIEGPHKSLWYNTLPGDGGTQVNGMPNFHWNEAKVL